MNERPFDPLLTLAGVGTYVVCTKAEYSEAKKMEKIRYEICECTKQALI